MNIDERFKFEEENDMKREYVKPMFVAEQFVANEYVATCVVGKCDLSSDYIYKWIDRDGDGQYDSGEREGWRLETNTACGSEDLKAVSGGLKDITPVVCFKSWEDAHYDRSTGAQIGWRFSGITPATDRWSTHVSSTKPTLTNAS